MILFPAIDIKDGKCVRLTQGDYNKEKIYSDDPAEVARKWEDLEASYLHLVDLDGAKSGKSANDSAIKTIANKSSLPVQVGGGIRSMSVIEDYLTAGIARVIIGTAAISDKSFLREALKQYGGKIAVSIDARGGYVATDGWTETSTTKAVNLIQELETLGVETIIYTDILKDGMLQGPNFAELEAVNQSTTMNVIASGGVTSLENIQRLKQMGLYGAIIGKALYDGTLDFTAAKEVAQDAR
ncbi:1-(5-phosphoribosyl)-5-[(5-phosphoribosylamino)methylideneamino]imidazole-4-carboxamide isomerase [Lentibacillus sediminis]|uniref:1-(5-phosphoribosyl)-5-[(5- phosphoribosylamino)methylideneamino]imidazole-4- carboxamide isomerase n=1 Tax=Lentibacillus sediminis TaxID=1940529 RepID=UPI000C1C623F|nr:1-(5-phosphoribosyl)-5-[(5-phosphoribosylamino)methylideneamino]imidazole-4-carboxamide isomerase [Lentibacillus sediminis]